MSIGASDIVKLLSDLSSTSDKIIEENAPQLDVPRIAEWATIVKNKVHRIAEGESSTESGEVPSLMSFLKGRRRVTRVSSALPGIQKYHLHGKGKASIKVPRKSRKSSIKTPLRRKYNSKDKNETIIIDSGKSNSKEKNETIIIDSEGETPLASTILISSSSTSTVERKKTTRSHSPLKISAYKKGNTSKMDRSSKRKSSSELSVEIGKKVKINDDHSQLTDPKKRDKSVENGAKLTKLKNSSLSANVSVLKENRTLRSKMESKQEKALENRKNILALRQEKIKLNKIRHETEKVNTTYVMTKRDEPSTSVEKSKEKQTSSKKMPMNIKKAGNSALKGNEKTPGVIKNTKHETEKVSTTYVMTKRDEPSTSVEKGKTLKGANPKTVKPLSEQKKQPIKNTPIKKKGIESYAITPARSSFVSYDISDIRSDSEDEEQPANSKPVPSWATGVRLRNSLLQQHHHPIDTDELFGNSVDPPDLAAIMGIKKKTYKKRTSSAIWDSSFK